MHQLSSYIGSPEHTAAGKKYRFSTSGPEWQIFIQLYTYRTVFIREDNGTDFGESGEFHISPIDGPLPRLWKKNRPLEEVMTWLFGHGAHNIPFAARDKVRMGPYSGIAIMFKQIFVSDKCGAISVIQRPSIINCRSSWCMKLILRDATSEFYGVFQITEPEGPNDWSTLESLLKEISVTKSKCIQ